jgi:hypothetical protein
VELRRALVEARPPAFGLEVAPVLEAEPLVVAADLRGRRRSRRPPSPGAGSGNWSILPQPAGRLGQDVDDLGEVFARRTPNYELHDRVYSYRVRMIR